MLSRKILINSTAFIVGAYFLFLSLSAAQSILAPFLTAVILALVILPVANKIESKMKRTYASLISTSLLLLLSIGFVALVSFQLKSVADKWPEIKETMKPKVEQFKTFISENTPIKKSDLERDQQDESSAESSS